MLDDIRAIPDTEELIHLIENFEFKKATDEISGFLMERVQNDA